MEGSGWRIEAACRAAWPPARTLTVDGWILGLSDTSSRRIASASPLTADAAVDPATIARIAATFAGAGQAALFRIPTLLPHADRGFDAAGFDPGEARTHTLAMALAAPGAGVPAGTAGVIIESHAAAAWRAARERLSGPAAALARLRVPALFARIEQGGVVRAVGYVAISEGIAVLEAIATDPALRRHGLGLRLVTALLGGAREAGAREAALQVMADNAPAIALYRWIGFDRHVYDYHYRRRPA